jgi:DNA replication and repair protein RecF
VRLERLVARGFRNLADLDTELPEAGAALLGRNGQGKTNLLEAIYYPVLFRSVRGATDQDIIAFGGPGFHIEVHLSEDAERHCVAATCQAPGRRKRILLDGEEVPRVTDGVGAWVAVAFLPSDVALASGPAVERRQFLDRMLALADRRYLRALSRFRAALAQRNSALRQHRPDVARAFDGPLGTAGAEVMRMRLEWAGVAEAQFAEEFEALGERSAVRLSYRGRPELADAEAWASALAEARGRDQARGMTTVGPHRDDVVLEIDGRPLRGFGSTGQQRSAAIALKLIEIATLRRTRGLEPALLLDDVFAELDGERQTRLARRLLAPGLRQVFVTAPRRDELPESLELPIWQVEEGRLGR